MKNYFKGALLLCMVFFVLPFKSLASEEKDLNDFYTKLESLKRPIEILDVDMYRDGGTVSVTFAGPEGEELSFSQDGRMGSPTAGSLFLEQPLTNRQMTTKVPVDSALENLILDLLKEWLSQDIDANIYNAQWLSRQKNQGYDTKYLPTEVLEGHRKWIKMLIASVERHKNLVFKTQIAGPISKDKAIDIAKAKYGFLVQPSEKIEVQENADSFEVIFIGIDFQEDGVHYKSTMKVVVSKETGEVVSMGAI